jgi:hypothetical protein
MFDVILFAGLAGQNVVQVEQQRPLPSAALCSPPIKTAEGRPYYYIWDIADDLFEQGKYLFAARAYYQVFRCGKWTPVDPHVVDANMLGPFDIALREAAAGNFVDAASRLNEIVKVLPQFGEARLLMGVFEWSAGTHAKARATWRSTISAPYFARSDTNYAPPAVTEARKLLRWSSTRK